MLKAVPCQRLLAALADFPDLTAVFSFVLDQMMDDPFRGDHEVLNFPRAAEFFNGHACKF